MGAVQVLSRRAPSQYVNVRRSMPESLGFSGTPGNVVMVIVVGFAAASGRAAPGTSDKKERIRWGGDAVRASSVWVPCLMLEALGFFGWRRPLMRRTMVMLMQGMVACCMA